jgi:hypothetical protein
VCFVVQEGERKDMFALFWLFATPQIEVHSEFPDSFSGTSVNSAEALALRKRVCRRTAKRDLTRRVLTRPLPPEVHP